MTVYLPRCKVSIDSIVTQQNWIMGKKKTMATTECSSVTGAIKPLTTTETKNTTITTTTGQTTSTLQSSYQKTKHMWGHSTIRGRWVGGGVKGGAGVVGHQFTLQKILDPLSFPSKIQGHFLLTLVHTISYSIKKRKKQRVKLQKSHKT